MKILIKVSLKICYYVMNFMYFFFKLLPTNDKKLFFLSRQTDKPSIDYRMLRDEIKAKYPEYKMCFCTKRIEKHLKDFLFKNTLMIFRQLYHLATSKVCIVDGYNVPVCLLKHKKSLAIIQIWHSLGAIKKFGLQDIRTEKKKIIAKEAKMHENYDVIVSTSNETTKYFMQAFGYPKSKFINIGLPRIDYLLKRKNVNRKKIYKKYKEFKNKKIILYAPTFRKKDNYKIDELIKSIDTEKYILIIKLHPYIKYERKQKKGLYYCDDFTSLQLLSVANYLITDYSAMSVEGAIMNIPIYIYAYDYEDYSKNPGINVNLEKEFNKYFFKESDGIYKSIKSGKYDLSVVTKYRNKYVDNQDGTSCKKLAKYIIKMAGEK